MTLSPQLSELQAAQRRFPVFSLPFAYVGLCFDQAPGFPDELKLPPHLSQALLKRQHDYLAGRWCAYRLYQHFGLSWDGLPMAENGAPQWPYGYCGSISHTRGLAIALMAPLSKALSIGVDLEHIISAKTALQVQKQILHPAEVIKNAADLTLVFSAKESIYKALNPLLKRFIGFDEVCFDRLDADQLSFRPTGALVADFPAEASQSVSAFRVADWVLTLYWLAAPNSKK